MEHRFKSFEQKKPRIYRFYDAGTAQDRVPDIIRLYKLGTNIDYITGELGVSHVFVIKTIRKYRDNNLHA
jgi:transposase-like protein